VHHVADDDWPTYLKSSLHELLLEPEPET